MVQTPQSRTLEIIIDIVITNSPCLQTYVVKPCEIYFGNEQVIHGENSSPLLICVDTVEPEVLSAQV
jgi:hypothetical protein